MTNRENLPGDRGLSPAVATVIDEYFARFRGEALAVGARGLDEEIADLRDHVLTRLEHTAGFPDDAVAILAELGSAAELAGAFAEPPSKTHENPTTTWKGSRMLAGRLLGVPYDLRTPDSGRYASRWWNPLDRRIFVPKALGLGWTVNFGALAVFTRIVRPDDEDVPFASVPPRIVAGTLLVPVLVLVAFEVLAAANWSALPTRVPTHWDLTGHVDGYSTRGSALLLLSVLAVAPVALAGWVHLRRRPSLNRVVASALSLSLTTLALLVLAQILSTIAGATGAWLILAGLACSLVLPFVLLVAASRIGRNAEQQRDLPDRSHRKGATDEH